jgi:hypothetical protein
MILLCSSAWANDIFISQSGDRLTMDITQQGENNVVKQYDYTSGFDGDDQNVKIVQEHSHGSDNNVIEYWHIDGNNNSLELRQGSDNLGGNGVRSDSTEYSGHTMMVDIHGNNNSIRIGQRNPDNSPHNAEAMIFADDASVEITQGSSGSKDASVTVSNDDSNISVLQHSNGAHTANIYTYGSYASNIQLEQKGTSANSYSLTQGCYTTGGCSATVTQQ